MGVSHPMMVALLTLVTMLMEMTVPLSVAVLPVLEDPCACF
jgi:hypothetical protein